MRKSLVSLQDLEVFLKAAELGSYTKAARQLNITQPAVSQVIRNLEQHFEHTLFERRGRNVILTQAGESLLPMARELISAAMCLEESMASLHGQVYGEINLGCSTTSGKYVLPGLIARFRKQFPLVRVNVLVNNRDVVIERLLQGQYAFGVSSKRIEHHDLEYYDFFTDEVILIAAANHPWAKTRRVFVSDLLEEAIILREEDAGTYEVMMEGLRAHGITLDMLNVAMTLGNAEAIEMAVEEGLGIAFISKLAAWRGLELGRIVEVEVVGLSLNRPLSMVRNLRLPMSRPQAEFWEFMCRQFMTPDFISVTGTHVG